MILLLLACTGEPEPVDAPAATPEMSSVALLRRASIDLRGVAPSLDELRAVQGDPEALDPLIEDFLNDPRFGATYAQHMAGVWLTPVTEIDSTEYTLAVDDPLALLAAMGAEPLAVLARVADEDLPYTELVTGDWTMVNEALAEFYPSDYPADGEGWRVAHYTDDRPAAGILATNGFYWRYGSTQANANRGRANAVSRILLCRDHLAVQIEGDRDLNLLDEDAVNDALLTADACVTCHASLDPIAGAFWGFYNHFGFSPTEQASYHPEREPLWEVYTGVPPGYGGEAIDGLSGLGRAIAADPRAIECAVERAAEQLLQRPAGLDDVERLTLHREAFLEGELTLRALVRSILADPAYRAAPSDDPEAAPWKHLTAAQYAAVLEDLTGFRFVIDGYDVFDADIYGVRSMAGGVGPAFDAQIPLGASPTWALVMERVAEAAAWQVTEADAAGTPRLFTEIDLNAEDPGDAAADQLVALRLRLLGQELPVEDEAIQRDLALWSALREAGGAPVDAWAGVLSTLLRSSDLLVY